MGPLSYAAFVTIPSLTYNEFGDYKGNPNSKVMYYSKVCESSIDYFGGIYSKNYDLFCPMVKRRKL